MALLECRRTKDSITVANLWTDSPGWDFVSLCYLLLHHRKLRHNDVIITCLVFTLSFVFSFFLFPVPSFFIAILSLTAKNINYLVTPSTVHFCSEKVRCIDLKELASCIMMEAVVACLLLVFKFILLVRYFLPQYRLNKLAKGHLFIPVI